MLTPPDQVESQSAPSANRYIGRAVRRVEDLRLLRGRGQYTADLRAADSLEMAVLRSPYPHARIVDVNLARARSAPGVVLALSGRDLAGVLEPLPNFAPNP